MMSNYEKISISKLITIFIISFENFLSAEYVRYTRNAHCVKYLLLLKHSCGN